MAGSLLWYSGISLPYLLRSVTVTTSANFSHWVVLLLLAGAFAFGCSLLLVFALYPSPTWRKGLGAALIALFGLLPVLTRISIPAISRFHPLSLFHASSRWTPPVSGWLLLCGTLVLGHLGYWAFRARGQRRVQVRYILAGVGLVCFSVLLQFFSYVPRTQIPGIQIPALACCCGFILLAYAHTARYPLLNGRLLLQPLLTFIVTLLIMIIFWGTFGISFYKYLLNTLTITFASRVTIFNILQATSFLLLYPLIAYLVQRFLLRAPYEERTTLARTSAALLSVYDIDEIADRLTGILEQTLRPSGCALYLQDGDDSLRRRGQAVDGDALPDSLPASHLLRQALARDRETLLAEELQRYCDERATIGASMHHAGAVVAVPLASPEHVCGCLLCSEKQSGDAYTRQDLQVLTALCQQTVLAVENARHHEQLAALNVELEGRVAERTRELADANSQLQQANTAKDFFLALVSHELLNPLTGIMGWADVGLRTDDPQMRVKVIDTIYKNSLRLKRLVYDLLDTARMIHGKLTVEPEPTDLWYLAMISGKNAEQELLTKQLKLVCEPPEEPLPITADAERMQQVIDNLLGNAIKFTPAGGTITFTGAREDDRCILSITDTGKGIPAERLSRIFERFQQAPGDHKAGGLGLGLALVRGILDLHGGTAFAESAGSGKGSTFTITLPMLVETPELDEMSAAV